MLFLELLLCLVEDVRELVPCPHEPFDLISDIILVVCCFDLACESAHGNDCEDHPCPGLDVADSHLSERLVEAILAAGQLLIEKIDRHKTPPFMIIPVNERV